jgi:uncharacterized protein (DUF2141 family)
LLPSICFAEDSEDTTFTVKGIITNYKPKAALYFAMYPSQKDFKERNFYRKLWYKKDKLPGDTVHFEFTGIQRGYYIIVGYQDMDGNGDINMGLFGPTEPYRVYLPNYGIFGPKFSRCKFLVDRDIDTVTIVFK